MDIQGNFSDININHQFSWYRGDDIYSNMSDDIFIYYCKGTKYRAFKIRRGIIGDKQLDYRDDYSLLKGNCGIYFLYGIENTPKGQVINVYVGKAEDRINSQGMDRLVEHVLNDEKAGAKYCNKWDKALFITIKEDTPAHPDFTSGVIKALESRFIKMFKGIEYTTSSDKNSTVKLVCYNGKFESGSNEPVDNYKTHIHAIIALLCHSGIRIIPESCEKKFVGEYTTDEVYARIQEYDRLNGELKNKIQEIEAAESKRIEALEHRNSARVIEEEIRSNFFNTYKLYKDKNVITVNNRIYSALDIVNNTKSSMVLTPYQTACNMVELVYGGAKLVDDKFILNFYCKDGIFITAIMNYIVKTSNSKKEDLRRFIGEQLFAVTPTIECFNITMHNILTHYVELMQQIDAMWSFDAGNCVLPHITIINNLETLVKTIDGRQFIKDRIEKEFGTVKFDVVIGNPPYNNDIYLDFVTLGDQLASKATCMITPAKWQAKTDGKPKGSKTDDKNETFRKNIVPRMSDIIYYPCTEDIFNIREVSGISIMLIGKDINGSKNIKVACNRNSNINSDFEEHDEVGASLQNRKILQIIGKMGQLGEGFKQSLYVKNTDHGEPCLMGQLGFKRQTFTGEQDRGELKPCGTDYVEVMQGEKVVGYRQIRDLFTTLNLDKWKITTSIMAGNIYLDDNGKTLGIVPCNILKPFQVPKGSYPVLAYFNTYEECISFKTYYESKLVSFLFYFGACGSTLTREFYRFIPDPKDWSCIYVDAPHSGVTPDEHGKYEYNGKIYCSLYIKYNLTPEEISIIESVIKERK